MNRRPLLLYLLVAALSAFSLLSWLRPESLVDTGLAALSALWRLHPWLSLATAVLLLPVRRASWYLGLAYGGYTVALAGISFLVEMRLGDGETVALVGGAACLFYLRRYEVKRLFLDPRHRWWTTPPRKRWRLRATIDDGLQQYECVTADLSVSGALIRTERRLVVGENVKITIHFPGAPLALRASVVRWSESPRGVGVRFMEGHEDIEVLLWGSG